MKKRPSEITIIAWLFIISGAGSCLRVVKSMNDPVVLELLSKSPIPIPLQFAVSYVNSMIFVVCGIFMLRGTNWARFLYIIWGAVGVLYNLITSPSKFSIVYVVIYGILAYLLLHPIANEFFGQ